MEQEMIVINHRVEDFLSKKQKQEVFASMSYQEKFEAILATEKPKYLNAPEEIMGAMYNAWLESEEIKGFLDQDIIENLERKLGTENVHTWTVSAQRLFVDIDGTLAVFRPCRTLEKLYEKGYFKNLEPIESVLEGVRQYKEDNPATEVFVLSAYLSDSKYALQEKNEWIDVHFPEIDQTHRIFPECGQDKSTYIPGGVKQDDWLVDDYSVNLFQWEKAGGKGIKLMNGINGTKGKWRGRRVDGEQNASWIAEEIGQITRNSEVKRNTLHR